MIWHNLNGNDFRIVFLCYLSNELFAAFGDGSRQHRASIFGCPSYMVFAGIDDVVVRLVFF